MTKVVYQGRSYERLGDETVLRCLLRNDVRAPYSCESGACQSCTMQATKGAIPSNAQEDLKETQKSLGYFKPCVCKPAGDIEVVALDDAHKQKQQLTVAEKSFLNDEILRLRLSCDEPFKYHAGQFVNLFKDDLIRSYSLASLPDSESVLELHVKRVPKGVVSNWLCDDVQVGDPLSVAGPMGECFYHKTENEDGLLAVGTGSGLAPLWGIIRDALTQGFDKPIILCHGGVTPELLYYVDELRELERMHDNFSYYPCVSTGDESDLPKGFSFGFPNDVAFSKQPALSKWQVFLCGHPDMVSNSKRKAFLLGASLKNIHADPFLAASPA
ncbi:MAG: 2Fe-2S iron-sulfur cluster binding domain-containing protein [Thiotrichaceae bacterium]|nr:2Fe-2S iron-sulfur cluster binding domain-containing protein [Thiotrichaceae bacterium]PCI11140.1 MAG: oxygenase [Thiotrichales bacterium]PCI12885.1 MAG: oxygenase [Thiotrichales bacterium]